MNTMDSTLQDFNEYLQANSHFIKNRSRTTGKGTLREIIQERVQHADRILNQIVNGHANTSPHLTHPDGSNNPISTVREAYIRLPENP